MHRWFTLAVASVALQSLGSRPMGAQAGATADVAAWVRAQRVPANIQGDSAAPNERSTLLRIIGDARIVGLGEGGHGVSEFLQNRNRLVRLLVERGRITALAAETGFTESTAVDDYIMGQGQLTPAIVGSVFSWSSSTPYAENRALLDWLRAYNARPSTRRKIHFYGLDLTGGRAGRFVQARLALDAAVAYISTVDSSAAMHLRRELAPNVDHFATGAHDSLSATQKDALAAAIDDVIALMKRREVGWVAATSREAFDRALHNAIVARELDANFRSAIAESNPQAQREPGMAENLDWVLQQEGPQGRILLYAANWHVSKGPMVTDRFGFGLGEFLASRYGRDYVAIGAAVRSATNDLVEPPDSASFAAVAARLDGGPFLVPLGDLPRNGPVAQWFATLRPLQGGRPDRMKLPTAFDAIYFYGDVHAATHSAIAAATPSAAVAGSLAARS